MILRNSGNPSERKLMQYILSKYLIKLKLILFFLFIVSTNIFAQINEYAIKTSFIFKFAQYTEWPQLNNKYFTVAVIGENPFQDSLDEIAQKKIIKGKEIKIKYINSISELDDINILFIPKSEKKLIPEIIKITKNKPILLISEVYKAASNGVHINFLINTSRKVRFNINTTSLKQSNLKMSSLLIKVAIKTY